MDIIGFAIRATIDKPVQGNASSIFVATDSGPKLYAEWMVRNINA